MVCLTCEDALGRCWGVDESCVKSIASTAAAALACRITMTGTLQCRVACWLILAVVKSQCCVQGVCQAAILLAGVFIGCLAQSTPSALPATDSGSTSHGAQATFTQVGNATRSRTVSRDGRAKTVGAASTADSMAVNSTDMVDADAIRGPPAMSEVETEPITDVPGPTVMSPPMPVAEGVVLCTVHCSACPGLTVHVRVLADASARRQQFVANVFK